MEPLDRKMQLATRVKIVGNEADRILEFIASTETPDRSGDIIDSAGWILENYLGPSGKGNPIFAWSHDYTHTPVGKTISVVKDLRQKALIIRVKFPTIAELCSDMDHPSESALFADTVYNMYKTGYLSAVSVGFRGLEFDARSDSDVADLPLWQRGMHFTKVELLEVSAVLVPCNQEALVNMRGMKGFRADGLKAFQELTTKELVNIVTAFAKSTLEEETDPSDEGEGNTAEGQSELFGEDGDMGEEKLKALEDRMKVLEAQVVKGGAKFSAETKGNIVKVVEALKASHKAIKGCHDALEKMIADEGSDSATEAPAANVPGDEGSTGTETPKPNDEGKGTVADQLKDMDFATATLSDAMKMIA